MAFDNTKNHIELNGQAYMVNAYQRTELSTFIPRLGPGDQTESQFDLLRGKTLRGFDGGMLQRYWNDDSSVFATENLYPIYDDGVLYPVNAPTTRTDMGTGRPVITAQAKTKDYLFVAWQSTTGGSTQGIKRIDSSGTVTSLTTPTNITNLVRSITDMTIWKNKLWVCGTSTSTGIGGMYYMDLGSTTLTEVTGGSGYFYKMAVWRDQLYGTNSGFVPNYVFYRYTGDTTTRSFVVLGATPAQTPSWNSVMFVFNNRVFLTRDDGLYAYDGTALVAVEDATAQVNTNNYRFPAVLKGYLYYFMPSGMYRYNGSLIEKLYDISELGMPKDVISSKDRLWLCYTNSAYSGSARYDKSMGYDYSTGTNVDGRVLVFNGKGMYTYARTSTFIKSGSPLLADEGENDKLAWFNDNLYIFTRAEPSNTHYSIATNENAISGNKSWRIVTSIFDGDFAMIDKNQENIEFVFDGNVSSDQSITLEYRTAGFDGSTGWTSAGTVSTQSEVLRQIWRTISAGLTFKKIQFRFSGTTAFSYGIAKIVFRYTLSPDYKNQWALTALCYGDNDLEPLTLDDGSISAVAVHILRGNIYASRHSDTPVKFIDIDQLDLNGAINDSTTTVVLNSTALIKGSSGFIQIEDEIMYWSAKTTTNLTVTRGVLGSTPASHANNLKVFLVYRVIVRQIQNERIILDNPEIPSEDKSRASEISLILQEV